jgi:hypothetical protein
MHVFNVGSTAALGTLEFEQGLQGDLPETLNLPARSRIVNPLRWIKGEPPPLEEVLDRLGPRISQEQLDRRTRGRRLLLAVGR